MSSAERFCPHCRMPVVSTVVGCNCPSCGQPTSDARTATTRDFTGLTIDGSHARRAGQIEGFPESLIGRRIGLYAIESLLGKGGMAWVFLATHNTLQRPSAIKVLCPELQGRHANSISLCVLQSVDEHRDAQGRLGDTLHEMRRRDHRPDA